MSDQELHAFVEAWVRWCATRRFYVRPAAGNLLARMQPAKVKEPPDARLSAELAWFNTAVRALRAMDDADAEAFMVFYIKRARNIKTVAADMGVARSTFYVKVRRFARRAWRLSQSLARADEQARVRIGSDKKTLDGPDT